MERARIEERPAGEVYHHRSAIKNNYRAGIERAWLKTAKPAALENSTNRLNEKKKKKRKRTDLEDSKEKPCGLRI